MLYYAGVVVVILAMVWFFDSNWQKIGPQGIVMFAVSYQLLFHATGHFLWRRPDLKIPGGLLVTLGVCMVPLITYGLIGMAGFWQSSDRASFFALNSPVHLDSFWWMLVHVSLAVASAVTLYFYRFPFLMAPLSFALWSIATTAPGILCLPDSNEQRAEISIFYGLLMLAAAYGIDLHRSQPIALVICGLSVIVCGLIVQKSRWLLRA